MCRTLHCGGLLLLLVIQRLSVSFANDHIAAPNQTRTEPEIDEEFPQETQSAQCTITAGEVQASAQATISKKLEGVCGSRQLAKSVQILESRLMNELYQIRVLLRQIAIGGGHQDLNQNQYQQQGPPVYRQPPFDYMGMLPQQSQKPHPPLAVTTPPSQNVHSSTFPTSPIQSIAKEETPTIANKFKSIESSSVLENVSTDYDSDDEDSDEVNTNILVPPALAADRNNQTNGLKDNQSSRNILFKPVQTKQIKSTPRNVLKKKSLPRELEVAKFNNTVLSGDDIRIFTYYWRIDNFLMKLQSNISVIYSPVFSISGLHLKIRAALNHLNRDYLFLQLESVPSDHLIDDSNVILESGTMFREIETKKLFRHKITILDQETPTSDLVSQEFLNTNSGFPVPNSAIISGPYAKDSNILIKVLIFI